MERLPSGEQYRIARGDQQATIVEVGGGVREYSQAGRPILDPYDARDYQVALTEPAKDNAIHGFLRWRPWRAIRHDADRVVITATVFPQTGYPFLLDVAVEYRLTDEGLVV